MIVDGHAHAAGEFFSAAGIVSILDEVGVDKVILNPGPRHDPKRYPLPSFGRILGKQRLEFAGSPLLRRTALNLLKILDFEEANQIVASLALRAPGRIVLSWWVDPTEKDLAGRLKERLSVWGYQALKVHQCFHRVPADGPGMRVLAGFAAEAGIPVFIHLYSRPDAAALIRLVAAFPETVFVIAHLLGLEVFMAADRKTLANVYFDTSPPSFLPLYWERVTIGHFGPEKVVLGSDTPYGKNNLRTAVARIRTLPLGEADKSLILGENARRIYRL